MNKLQRELYEWGLKNERMAQEESVECLKKAYYSSMMPVWIFTHADRDSIFEAKKIMKDILDRTNHSLQTLDEIENYVNFLYKENKILAKIEAAEIIIHLKGSAKNNIKKR